MEKMSAEKPGLPQGSFFISALKDFIAIMTAIAKALHQTGEPVSQFHSYYIKGKIE